MSQTDEDAASTNIGKDRRESDDLEPQDIRRSTDVLDKHDPSALTVDTRIMGAADEEAADQTLQTTGAAHAETVKPGPDPNAATLMTVGGGNDIVELDSLPQHRIEHPGDPNQMNDAEWPSSDSYRRSGSATQTGSGTGVLSKDGQSITRRTRANVHLPNEVQSIDQSLQLSRNSVFVDMVRTRRRGDLPPLVRERLSRQDTIGRYIVNTEVARGGMGTVLDIDDHDFRRGAAMKVMHARYADDPLALERFIEEAQVTAQLEHPNIVPVHDLGVMQDGSLYYTMKLVQGRSLGAVIKELKNKKAETLAFWSDDVRILNFLKVLDGVGYAHEKNVIHRDIKPDNIMIEAHGEVLVVDWGIAKVMDQDEKEHVVRSLRQDEDMTATVTGAALGTPYYMSPEQARGDKANIDLRSDIFSLGATLYELLTLQRPYPKKPVQELIGLASEARYNTLSDIAPDMHPDLAAIIRKAMAADPAMRFNSCAEFAADLRRYLAGQAVHARVRGRLERMAAWLQNHKRQVGMTALALAILSIGAAATALWQEWTANAEAGRHANQARTALETASATTQIDLALPALQAGKTAIERAAGLRPDDAVIIDLRQRIDSELGRLNGVHEERTRRDAARQTERQQAEQALATAKAAQQSVDSNELRKAQQALTIALELDGSSTLRTELAQTLQAIDLLVKDQAQQVLLREAQHHHQQAKQLLHKVEQRITGIPVIDAASIWKRQGDVSTLLKDVARCQQDLQQAALALQRAGDSGLRIAGLDDSRLLHAKLQQQSDWRQNSAQSQAQAWQHSTALSKQAKQALHDGKLDEAHDLLTRSADRLASNAEVPGLQQQLHQAQFTRQQQLALQQRQARARESLQAGQKALANWRTVLGQLNANSKKLEELASGTQSDQVKLQRFALHDRMDELHQQLQQLHVLVESKAQQVLETLGDQADGTLVQAARRLMADFTHARWQQAELDQDLSQAALLLALLGRYDSDGRYADVAEGRARLMIAGAASGQLRISPLRSKGMRLQNTDEHKDLLVDLPLKKPLTLQAGRYRLSNHTIQIDWRFIAGADVELHWPQPQAALTLAPDVSIPLAYLPAADGGAGNWLSSHEITHAAYGLFVNDPAQFKHIAAQITAMQEHGKKLPIPFKPICQSRALQQGFWPHWDRRERPESVVIPAGIANWPVSGISRADAEAFCRWLSQRSGRKIRLPTAAEYGWAMRGGDPERVYPWGRRFEASFTHGHRAGRDRPTSVTTPTQDIGPFGHHFLAGNVREWLSDTSGPLLGSHDGLIAGASWNDSRDQNFRSTYTEPVPASLVNHHVGFRIIVTADTDHHKQDPAPDKE